MTNKSCFVIMAIGDQHIENLVVSSSDLRRRYDDLIKEAILRADPGLEVTRADDVAMPGTITTDIITRIMKSDLVVADVTFPNPNVFYELGLRHACRTGTIIIRERSNRQPPFDIAHLRHIEYENSATGLKELADRLASYIANLNRHLGIPDNQFQELARLTNYEFPDYRAKQSSPEEDLMVAAFQSPILREFLMRSGSGEEIPQQEVLRAMMSEPNVQPLIARIIAQSGSFSNTIPPKAVKQSNRKKKRR